MHAKLFTCHPIRITCTLCPNKEGTWFHDLINSSNKKIYIWTISDKNNQDSNKFDFKKTIQQMLSD